MSVNRVQLWSHFSLKRVCFGKLQTSLCITFYIEVHPPGFATNNIDGLTKFAKKNNINYMRLISKYMESALRASYYIFCIRNKDWVTTELLYFY